MPKITCLAQQRLLCGFLYLAILLSSNAIWGQGDERNLAKYWRYRQRLQELFVKVGPGAGESVPASEIDQWRVVFGNGGVTWAQSDGTATLGWYIAVLATEHGLLKKFGLPTTENEEELYFALNALWRLDAQSDFYGYERDGWPACTTLATGAPMGPMTVTDYDDDAILDGFAIRSDAQYGFHTNFPGMDNTSSEVISPYGHNCRSKEMSQDQGIFLIMGLMAVKQWVSPDLEYNGVPLRRFAINEGVRIVNVFRSPPKNDWVMRNPVTDSTVRIGASGLGWRYPKAVMGEVLLDSPGAFHSGFPNTLWIAQGFPVSFGIEMNTAMAAAMAAIGNAWGDQTAASLNRLAVPSTPTEQGQDREIYYAYHHLLYGSPLKDSHISSSIYKHLLDVAPCDGPHSTWPETAPFYGWTTDSRFTGMVWGRVDLNQDGNKENYNQFIAGPQGSSTEGRGDLYTGLDYMLLFNLYYLMYDGTEYDPEGNYQNLFHATLDTLCNVRTSTLQMVAFPNPNDGQFQIRLRIPDDSPVRMEIFGSDGKVLGPIFESQGELGGEILENFDLRQLDAGMYMIRAFVGTEEVRCRVAVVR